MNASSKLELHLPRENPSARTQSGLLILGFIFIALNMRAPLTSVGPLIGTIRDDLGMSNTLAGSITTIPLLAFALLSPFTPMFARRLGMERVLLYALILLVLGTALRSVDSGISTLFGGTILIGLAIALCNVLLPSLIKRDFPLKIGLMTGIYSLSMNLSGAIATGISVPLSNYTQIGWKGALGCWGILALLATFIWLPQLRSLNKPSLAAAAASIPQGSIWRSSLAWKVTLLMGTQSLIFYVTLTWLPEILVSRGMSASSAGWMLSCLQFAQLPCTFIVPILAARMKNQQPLVGIITLLYLIGFGGLFIQNTALVPIWAIILGIAGGSSFSLVMMFFSLRTRQAHEAARLSGMAQSFGYLFAAFGPIVFGMLHDTMGSWTLPLCMLITASLLISVFGLGAAKNQYIWNSH
ncbi:CynX/NimT family MFS transporter [Paenibacillus nasutitermitis]|uniref:MFS transporter n=1 Tax=Paenibacillus nasutitermitis TaxID=1652958 RepID=A0A917E240_9BACL|nr:MFS transporter [Paenibacillus nasutitermitis]GGD95092.1 MFS transporter [Paenibacillus nasutitermitis]